MTLHRSSHRMSGSLLNFDCPESSVPFALQTPDLCLIEQIGIVMTSTRDFYSFRDGAFDVTVLSDAPAESSDFGPLAENVHTASDGCQCEDSGFDEICLAPSNIPFPVTADEMILVDVGAGERKSEHTGFLEANLEAIGVHATDISLVVLTHAHPCHIWGLVRPDGSLRYANARYVMSEAEWSFWMTDNDEPTTEYERMSRAHMRKTLSAILGRVTLVEDGDEIIPGLRVLSSCGHTPGHITVILESDVPLIVTGDAGQAATMRRQILNQAEEERAKLLGFRWRYPGVGRAERLGSAFRLRRVPEVTR